MKQIVEKSSMLTFALVVCLNLTASLSLNVFGQGTPIPKADFEKKTEAASSSARETFPRRETKVDFNRTDVYGDDDKLIETVINDQRIKEFLRADKIRYEFKKINTEGTTITNRLEIGGNCYEQNEKGWEKITENCSMNVLMMGISPAKTEYFVENGTLDAKPVKIYRRVETERASSGETPSINEYVSYVDAAGRLVKTESLSRKATGKTRMQGFTTYEYNVKIAPIVAPSIGGKTRKRRLKKTGVSNFNQVQIGMTTIKFKDGEMSSSWKIPSAK